MEDSKKEIPLTFNRKDFEVIYFRNKQGNICLSPLVKKEFITFTVFLTLFSTATIYSLITDKNVWLIVVSGILLIIMFLPYYYKASRLQKWRNSVNEFIKQNEKVKHHKLILTKGSLTLVQDEKEEIHKWTTIKKAEINVDYLTLTGTSEFIFPRISMTSQDYDYLIEEIKKHVQNGL